MSMHIDDNKLAIITEPKTICFNLTKNVDDSLRQEIDQIIKHNGFLAEQRIKSEIDQL